MKFMGSKRAMLENGLGEVLAESLSMSNRFADLFTGSGSVAWFVSRQWDVEVIANDLQVFAVALAEAVISRTQPLCANGVIDDWIARARECACSRQLLGEATSIQERLGGRNLERIVRACRVFCSGPEGGPVLRAYGGYYFSPLQAIWIDSMRETLPDARPERTVGLAALIQAASRCAASPGHTAQPFKPNATAGPFLMEAWSRDPMELTMLNFERLGKLTARRAGKGVVGNAAEVVGGLKEGDLAFVDPPYSGVHYSRFYHVLETVALGEQVEVSGTGRYPPSSARPRSDFSIVSKSSEALRTLLAGLAKSGARVVITFPAGAASNGLSGKKVMEVAAERFHITRKCVTSRFSTLGGNSIHRSARQVGDELILTLSPR